MRHAEFRFGLNFVVVVGFVGLVTFGCGTPPDFDLVIRGGQVLDGTGAPAVRADVGIRGDAIAAVGDLSAATTTETIA